MEKIDRAEVIISKIKNGMTVKKLRKDLAVIGLASILFASSAGLAITSDNVKKNTVEIALNNIRQSAVTAQVKSSSIYGEWLANQLAVNTEAFERDVIDQETYLANNQKFTSDEYISDVENMKKIGLNSSLISAQEDVNNNRKSLKREDSRLEIERGIEAFLVGTSGAGLIGMAYATFLNKKYEQEKARKQRRDQFMENLYGCDRLINEEEITLGD